MTLPHSLFASLAIGAGLLQAGCLADSNEVDAIDDVRLEAMEGSQQGGNGLLDTDFGESFLDLVASTNAPFNGNNLHLINLASTKAGTNTLDYVAACALTDGNYYGVNGNSFLGGGMLVSTTGWPSNALVAQAKYDLMECMIALVNPFGNVVPVRMSGEAIANDPNDPTLSQFSFHEGLWVAYEDATGLVLEMWPLHDVTDACGAAAHDAVQKRACGSLDAHRNCQVTVRDDYQNHCTQDTQTLHWSCDGHRAILTRLKILDWLTLYPTCAPTPG